jgi:hypothetical protein
MLLIFRNFCFGENLSIFMVKGFVFNPTYFFNSGFRLFFIRRIRLFGYRSMFSYPFLIDFRFAASSFACLPECLDPPPPGPDEEGLAKISEGALGLPIAPDPLKRSDPGKFEGVSI